MLKIIAQIFLLLASLVAIALAINAMVNNDWQQACAWLLIDISCTLSSLSTRD